MAYHNDNDRMLKIPMYDPRAQPLQVESVGVFDEPTITVCINRDWARKHIVNVLYRLAWADAWEGTQSETALAVSETNRLILALSSGVMPDGACVNIGETLLRQNPDNSCQLQQSNDGGFSWALAFDYSLCLPNTDVSDSLQQIIDQLTALQAAFDGSVGSLAPDAVYDSSPTDEIRDIALCHALNELVDLMCEMELQRRDEISFASNATGVILGLVGIAVGIVSAGSAVPVYLAIASALASGFGTLFNGLSEAILGDGVARDAVACCMKQYLDGATISQLSFEQSLDNCGFVNVSNEAQLAGAISQLLTQDNMYMTFLDYIQRSFRLAELGIASCPCEDLWCYKYEPRYSDLQGWNVIKGRPIADKIWSSAGGVSPIGFEAEQTFTAIDTATTINFGIVVGQIMPTRSLWIIARNGGIEVANYTNTTFNANSSITQEFSLDVTGITFDEIEVGFSSNGIVDINAWLDYVNVIGDGTTNPLGTDNC